MVTIGRLRRVPPIDPKNGAPPKANTPPSVAASHVPAPVGVGAVGPLTSGSAAADPAGTAAGRAAVTASTTDSQRRIRRVPRIVVPDTLRVGLPSQKRGRAGSTLSPRFAVERGPSCLEWALSQRRPGPSWAQVRPAKAAAAWAGRMSDPDERGRENP